MRWRTRCELGVRLTVAGPARHGHSGVLRVAGLARVVVAHRLTRHVRALVAVVRTRCKHSVVSQV